MVKEEGAYANGRVHVDLLPEEVHGPGCTRDFLLRRLDAKLAEEELQEHLAKELSKVGVLLPHVLRRCAQSTWAS